MATPIERILYIDDDRFSRQLLEFYFEDDPITLKTVETPDDFFAALSSFKPDVVLMDAQLESTSGLTLAMTMDNQGSAIPVVFLSSSRLEVILTVPAPKNIRGSIEKPFAPETLLANIAQLLDHPNACAQQQNLADVRLNALKHQYLSHLAKSLPDFSSKLAQLETMSHSEREHLTSNIHKVAGTSGLHGLTTLSRTAKQLEEALDLEREPPGLDTLASAFLTSLEAAVAELSCGKTAPTE